MANYHIQKSSVLDPSITVYYQKKGHWTETYSKRKKWTTSTTPTNLMANPDGTNGGFKGASVVEE